MRKKAIKLFDKTIHEVKDLITKISIERKVYHKESIKKDRERSERRRKHDKAIKNQIKELLEVLDDLYELFTDLSNGNGK